MVKPACTKLGHVGMLFFANERRSVRNIVLCHDCVHCPGFIDTRCHASTLELFLVKKDPSLVPQGIILKLHVTDLIPYALSCGMLLLWSALSCGV